MFEQLKRKRMMIEQSVAGKKYQRQHMSSAERRRLIEKDLSEQNQMIQTMQNFRKTQANNLNNLISNKAYSQQQFDNSPDALEVSRPLMQTPTVKDINPSLDQQQLAKQFYELSIDNKNDSIVPTPNKNSNLVDFFKKQAQEQKKIDGPVPININTMEENQSHRQSQPHIEEQQIKFPKLINSSKTQSNNNSQAIFFTSQFKQFLNNEPHSPQKISPIKQQVPKQLPIVQMKPEVKVQKNLNNNASGQSLAISNDSSLKYSLNQSAIHDIINKKLSNQLVVQSINQSPARIIQNFAFKIIAKENMKDFVQFTKEMQIKKLLQKRKLVSVFDKFMINKQYKYEVRKEEIQIQHFQQRRNQGLMNDCFYSWLNITKSKQENIEKMVKKKEREIKQKSFKTLKMLLFDRRINSQVDLYYLSKIFLAFKTVAQKQGKRQNQKSYRLYIKNLKKRIFRLFIEGCYNTRRQNQLNEGAYNHHYYTILNRYFQAWKNMTPKEEKIIRLSITTKNVLKETADKRLLHTKTFDFYEVK